MENTMSGSKTRTLLLLIALGLLVSVDGNYARPRRYPRAALRNTRATPRHRGVVPRPDAAELASGTLEKCRSQKSLRHGERSGLPPAALPDQLVSRSVGGEDVLRGVG
jgi:hypothetical protein